MGVGPRGGSLADRIVARDARIRAEELGTVWDLKSWLDLHSVDPTDPFAKGIAGGAGRRAGSDGTPVVDEFAVREYPALRHRSEPTARVERHLPHPGVFLWRAPHGHWFLSTKHGTPHLGPLPDTGHPAQTTTGHPTIELAEVRH
ncbi:MAG TPA: hypothetical protein VFR88_13670 [Microlunatus sp.]|nr:hypothetical protein [Microlunatus sp.]